jgi:hypothetical protein
MKQYGLVKTLKYGDDEIKLVGNAITYIRYKSYFHRDMLMDIVAFGKKNANKKALDRLQKFGIQSMDDIDKLTDQQVSEVFGGIDEFNYDCEFVLNFIAALMSTAKYPEIPDVSELICSIPPQFVVDQNVIRELLDFLSFFGSQKKS